MFMDNKRKPYDRPRGEGSNYRKSRSENELKRFNSTDSVKNNASDEENAREDILEGRNPVIEALRAGRTIEKLLIPKGAIEGSLKVIVGMAKDKGIVISEVDRKKLDDLSQTGSHQGVVAIVSTYEYSSLDEILEYAGEKEEAPFIIILDEIEDPHNFGSIVRSANVYGAHGVIIPKRRSASVTAAVSKASAGAVEHTRIAKVTNINQTIKELKDRGLWIVGTDMDGEVCYKANLKGPMAVVIGSEGKGISRLVKENCDIVVSIPIMGEINSLNASVAGGVIMYEIIRQRGTGK
jgi:23S rRNA (guanosine2251-2'-O)-methyltransferase